MTEKPEVTQPEVSQPQDSSQITPDGSTRKPPIPSDVSSSNPVEQTITPQK